MCETGKRRSVLAKVSALAMAALVLTACSSSTKPPNSSPKSTTTSTSPAAQALAALVAPTPAGFTSETISLGGGPTGLIGANEATSSDCNLTGVLQSEWVASGLRYFDHSTAFPQTYLVLCVTLMKSAGAATANQKEYEIEFGNRALPYAPIPGAIAAQVGPATEVTFADGPYCVSVLGTDLTPMSNASLLTDSLAAIQYHRLPA